MTPTKGDLSEIALDIEKGETSGITDTGIAWDLILK
jgi:hypothetical protein